MREQPLPLGQRPLGLEVHLVEERAGPALSDPLAAQEAGGGLGIEGLVEQEREPDRHGGVHVQAAGHVGEREHQGEAVVAGQVQPLGHAQRRRPQGTVTVAGALGLRGGPGRVVDEPHRHGVAVDVVVRRGGEAGGVTLGQ